MVGSLTVIHSLTVLWLTHSSLHSITAVGSLMVVHSLTVFGSLTVVYSLTVVGSLTVVYSLTVVGSLTTVGSLTNNSPLSHSTLAHPQ